MSFFRAATKARSIATRSYSAQVPTPKKGSLADKAIYFQTAGVAGIALWSYIVYNNEDLKPGFLKPAVPEQIISPLSPDNFTAFKLKKVDKYNHNTSTFTFELPKNEASLLPVASCLVVKCPDEVKDAKGKPIVRPYTPISSPTHKGELVLLVKKYEGGNASVHIHSLSPGDSLEMKGPFPKFNYKVNEFDQVGLIGGGSGITPLYQIVSYALADKANKTKFTLLFSNVTEADILMREEFAALKKAHPNTLNIVYALDKPEADWKGEKGFVSAELVKKHIPGAELNEKVKVFICGPPGQVAAVAGKKAGMKQGELGGVLKTLGYTEEQVYKF